MTLERIARQRRTLAWYADIFGPSAFTREWARYLEEQEELAHG